MTTEIDVEAESYRCGTEFAQSLDTQERTVAPMDRPLPSVPDGDYTAFRREFGTEIDARAYWIGYNSVAEAQ